MEALLSRILAGLPMPARRFVDPRRVLLAQFLRFGVVGLIGFGIDTAIVYALRAPIGLYAAGMVSYLVAGSAGWALNRLWTFRGRSTGRAHRQWVLFLATNVGGLLLNRGAYVALIATSPLCVRYPVLAVAAGAVAGMFVNFAVARNLVFR